MFYSKNEIIKIIEDFIEQKNPLSEWDEFTSIKTGNKESDYWSNRARDIENRYSDIHNGVLINEDGINELKALLHEIRGLI
jgi:hypothetical protein